MTNKGIVKEVNGEMLTVEFERHEACGDCHACMHGSTDCAKHTITIRGKADVGDEIVVEMDESHVMAASATAYLIGSRVSLERKAEVLATARKLREDGTVVTVMPMAKNMKHQIGLLEAEGYTKFEKIYE